MMTVNSQTLTERQKGLAACACLMAQGNLDRLEPAVKMALDNSVTIINTFMEAYDFKGKTVIPFATSGGSSIKKACEDLKAAYPDVNWKEGKLLNRASKDDMKKWIESNQ